MVLIHKESCENGVKILYILTKSCHLMIKIDDKSDFFCLASVLIILKN